MKLVVNNNQYDFFNGVNVTLKYDSVGGTFKFDMVFNPDDPNHRELVRPLTFPTAKIVHGSETLLTGTVVHHSGNSASADSLVTLSGYSIPGILEDVTIPLSAWPLQSDTLSLREIANRVCDPFNVVVKIDPAVSSLMNQTFDSTDARPDQTVKSYLTTLASQKSIILSSTPDGHLLFTKATTNKKPIADLSTVLKKTLVVDGRGMNDTIVVVGESNIDGGNAAEASYSSGLITNNRPRTVVQSSGDDNDSPKVASQYGATQLKKIALTIELHTWTIEDRIIFPNNLVTVQDKKLGLYEKSDWFVEAVTFTGNESKQVSTLSCVPPSAFDGTKPKNPFK